MLPMVDASSHLSPRALWLQMRLGLLMWACLCAALFTPLVINTQSYYDAFFSPKWAWIESFAAVGLAAALGRALLNRPLKFSLNPVWIALVAFALWHFITIAWARSPSLGLERALRVTALTLIVGIALHVVRTRRALINLGWCWLGVALIVALWTLKQDAQYAWWPEKTEVISNLADWRGYLAAGLGNTNHIGDLVALALAPTLVILGEARRTAPLAVTLIGAVVLAAALTVCYSVGSNMGLIAGAAVMLVLVVRRERLKFFRRRGRWIALGALWAAMLAFFIFDHPINPHRPGILRQGFGSERWREGGPTRLVIWAGTAEMIRTHSWLGVGAGNFTYVYPEMDSALLKGRPDLQRYRGAWTNAAHNIFLQVWAELGVVGFFIFLAALIAAYHSLLREIGWANRPEFLMRMTLAGMLSAALVHGMMNFSLQQPSGALTLYLLLAAAVVERSARKPAGKMPPLVFQAGPARLQVDWETMNQPLALGLGLQVPAAMRVAIPIVLLAGASAAVPFIFRPVRAHTAYTEALKAPTAAREEHHYRRALRLDPWATDCRSRYSEFLIEQNRPMEALEQLDRVRARLNSRELWEREARAWSALGEGEKARQAYAVFWNRLPPQVKNASPPPENFDEP